jgi:hypothetical protein
MNYFPKINKWHIPRDVLQKSLEEMAVDGGRGNEGICLWLGDRNDDGNATITHMALLRGPGVVKSPANIQIAPELMREVHGIARENGLTLVGQIHSHGREYGVSLSYTDRKYGISVPYYLSLVAPDYGMNKATKIEDCGVHVFLPKKGYVRLGVKQVKKSVRTKAGRSVTILTIGDDESRR